MTRWVLGVDPGCPGALALLDPAGSVVVLRHGPMRKIIVGGHERSEIDVTALHELLCQLRQRYGLATDQRVAMVENVHAISGKRSRGQGGDENSARGNGAVQAFSYGRNVQAWLQACEIEGWPIARVAPQSWQRHVPGIAGTGDARKLSYHAAALSRWPEQRGVLVGPRGGARLDPAAALWIAEHARLRT